MKFRLFIGLTAILWPLCGLAQSSGNSASDAAEPIQFYDVEVVIFKNLRVPKSREYVLPVSSPRKDEVMFDIGSPQDSTRATELGFELLPTSEYRLVEQVAKLVASSRYELLTYVAWRQPGLERGETIPVWITGGTRYGNEYTSIDDQLDYAAMNPPPGDAEGGETQFEFDEQSLEALELKMLERQTANLHQGLYELEGKITIALSRYLHTYTDLVLRRPRRTADAVPNTASQDLILSTYAADTRILNNHSLKEHRRMRSKNLHYLDNPEFSMLILITPYDAPEDSAQLSEVQ
jgi:hypothetical protein